MLANQYIKRLTLMNSMQLTTRMYKIFEPVCQIILSKPLPESVHQPIPHLKRSADSYVHQSLAILLAIQNRIFVLTE